MANHALALVEAALRARKLDRTLTTALPLERIETMAAPTDLASLDSYLHPTAQGAAGTPGLHPTAQGAAGTPGLGGGLPRGQLSEIAGLRSSGRTTLLLQVVAAATRRGEIAALVDTFDRFDISSAVSADVALDRLLWIRGEASSLADRAIERGLKALNLVLHAGGFGVVAIDLADAPLAALNRIPFTTWLRIQRVIEGSDTACVIVGPQPLARSAGGLTLSLAGRSTWAGASFLAGLDVAIRVVSPRRQVDGEVTVAAVASDSR